MIEIEAELASVQVLRHEVAAIRVGLGQPELIMKRLALGIVGAAVLTATYLLVQREASSSLRSLDQIRASGL